MKLDLMSRKKSQQRTTSHARRAINLVITLPRLGRILLVTVLALCVTVVLTPLVDIIYADNFFSEETRIVPALISAGCGVTFYVVGWWLIVGIVGEQPPPRKMILWYCGVGLFSVALLIFLIIRGINLVTYFT